MSDAMGFAVVDEEGLNVKTVSLTRRAAMVNWLVVKHKLAIYYNSTDEWIGELWRTHKGDARCVAVSIVEVVPVH